MLVEHWPNIASFHSQETFMSASSTISHIVLDVETANSNRHSICQIGIVTVFADGSKTRDGYYVDPKEEFTLTYIHNISAKDVRGCPTFAKVYNDLFKLTHKRIVVAHSDFDAQALRAACRKIGADPLDCVWVDSVAIARQAWPRFPNHKLKTLCSRLGIPLKHHDALEDAYSTAVMVDKALAATRSSIQDWTGVSAWKETKKGQKNPQHKPKTARPNAQAVPSAQGIFFGQRIALAGNIGSATESLRLQAAEAGFVVEKRVTRNTSFLVVGERPASDLEQADYDLQVAQARQHQAKKLPITILDVAKFQGVLQKLPTQAASVKEIGVTANATDVQSLPRSENAPSDPSAPIADDVRCSIGDIAPAESTPVAYQAPKRILGKASTTAGIHEHALFRDFFCYKGTMGRKDWALSMLWAFAMVVGLAVLLVVMETGTQFAQTTTPALVSVGGTMLVFFGYMLPASVRRLRGIGIGTWAAVALIIACCVFPLALPVLGILMAFLPNKEDQVSVSPVKA